MRQLLGVQGFTFGRRIVFVFVKLSFLFFPLLFVQFGQNVNYHAPLVITAIGADGMGINGGTAMSAFSQRANFKRVMRTRHVPLAFGMLHSDYHIYEIPNYQFLISNASYVLK